MRKTSSIALIVLIAFVVASCASTPQTQTDRYALVQTAVLATQSAAQAFGLVYQTNKGTNPEEWGKRYDLALLSYQGSQILLATAANEAALTETKVTLASWDALKQQIQTSFVVLAGPR